MSRELSPYRRVSIGMWADEKFRSLSRLQPCGQSLWLVLLVGEQTSNIPGLMSIGRAAMAEQLEWSLEAFDIAYAEVYAQGLAIADFKARLIWVPNALKYNLPQSPKVVIGWGKTWSLLPDCDLKAQAWEALRNTLKSMDCNNPEAFVEAFDKACAKPMRKPIGKNMCIQEQEQCTPPSLFPNGNKETPPKPKKIIFKAWLEVIKSKGEKPISTYQPVWDHAKAVGLDPDWIQIAWAKFCDRYLNDAGYKAKRYIDWRRHFLNAIEGNWFDLWRAADNGFVLTTVGRQADLATREAA